MHLSTDDFNNDAKVRNLSSEINEIIAQAQAICICVYTVKLPPDTLSLLGKFGWRQCDLRPTHDMGHVEGGEYYQKI